MSMWRVTSKQHALLAKCSYDVAVVECRCATAGVVVDGFHVFVVVFHGEAVI